MEEGTSLEDILGGDEAPAPEQEAPGGPVRDEHGRFASASPPQSDDQGEAEQEAPPASEPEPGHIPIAALKDERSKRQRAEEAFQEAQQRLQQYEAHFAQLNAPQAQEQEEDPVEWLTQQVLARVQPQTQQQHLVMKVEVAEQFARSKWEDYDEKVETFKEEAQRNPFLWRELAAAANPAEYAYNAATNILAARTYGTATPPSEADIEARLREKIMAEIGMKQPNVPTSLASAQSRGSRSGPAWAGPTPIGDILAG